jgi:hypothetical protein
MISEDGDMLGVEMRSRRLEDAGTIGADDASVTRALVVVIWGSSGVMVSFISVCRDHSGTREEELKISGASISERVSITAHSSFFGREVSPFGRLTSGARKLSVL